MSTKGETMTETNNFFGCAIKGEISRYSEGMKEQHDPVILLNELVKLLNMPGVMQVRWEQYTPYFNDGDPCTFSTSDAQIKLEGMDETAGDWENGFLNAWDLTSDYHKKDVENYKGDLKEVSEQLKEFSGVLCGGHHNAVLNQKFGDPAAVIAYVNEGEVEFSVEFYEHD